LGHVISKGKCRLGPEGIETKRELQKFLGLIGYCRLWIESYALSTETLYSKVLEEDLDPLCWEPEKVQRKSLIMPSELTLPFLEKPFHLFVNVDK
jgi:hypothetical protein